MSKKEDFERKELLWRIVVGIVTGIILHVWTALIVILFILHWFMVLFTGKRDIKLADFCEYWNSEVYRFVRYLTFETNEKPFPFTDLKRLNRFEK